LGVPPKGYKGWGGGLGPTGLTNSPNVQAQNRAPNSVSRSVNQAFYVIIRTSNVPQQAPAVFVPRGASVLIRAHNGTSNGNADLVRVSDHQELLGTIDGDPITPDSEITWPCDVTNFWIVGTAGDGVRVAIQAGRA